MSIRLITSVWNFDAGSHSTKLVLLALADCANDDGEECFPSITTLAEKCNMSRQGVLNQIAKLKDSGVLEYKRCGRSNRYKLTLEKPVQQVHHVDFRSPPDGLQKSTTLTSEVHAVDSNHKITAREPSLNPREEAKTETPEAKPSPKGARPISEEWLETIKPLYPSIDINHQLERARVWCATKGKELSQQRFTNWLKKSKPIAQAQTLSDETAFGYIWNRYPRHRRPIEKQSEVFGIYNQTVPDDKTDEVCEAFDRFLASEDWTKQGGKFVPSIGKFFASELWMNPPAKTEPKSIL